MGGGGSKTQVTENKVPQWLEDAGRRAVDLTDKAQRVGPSQWYGADIAAFSPDQQAAMANQRSAASAFGLQGGSGSGYMPQAQQFGDGSVGYSGLGGFQNQLAAMQQFAPGQLNRMMAFFDDPTQVTPQSQQASGSGLSPSQAAALALMQMPQYQYTDNGNN